MSIIARRTRHHAAAVKVQYTALSGVVAQDAHDTPPSTVSSYRALREGHGRHRLALLRWIFSHRSQYLRSHSDRSIICRASRLERPRPLPRGIASTRRTTVSRSRTVCPNRSRGPGRWLMISTGIGEDDRPSSVRPISPSFAAFASAWRRGFALIVSAPGPASRACAAPSAAITFSAPLSSSASPTRHRPFAICSGKARHHGPRPIDLTPTLGLLSALPSASDLMLSRSREQLV